MKCFPDGTGRAGPGAQAGARGFTLTEVLVASSIFLLVVGGVIMANSFGMRMLEITQPKLASAGRVRSLLSQIHSDISRAKFVRVGNGDWTSFAAIDVGLEKRGNAIEIYPSSDTNVFTRYYLDAAEKRLKRVTESSMSPEIVANAISNNLVFSGEDFAGTILTNNQNYMVIGVMLQYYELEDTATPVGAANYYKSYGLTNRVTWHAR